MQPLRAVLVLVVAAVIGVAVLARMGAPSSPAAAVRSTTTSQRGTVPPVTTTRPTTATTSPTTTTTTIAPASVTVLVLNGWTTRHAALFFQKKLAGDGYDTLAPADASSSTNKTSKLFVVKPADNPNGIAMAQLLGLPATDVVVPTAANDAAVPALELGQADLIVVVGADISGQVPAGYNG